VTDEASSMSVAGLVTRRSEDRGATKDVHLACPEEAAARRARWHQRAGEGSVLGGFAVGGQEGSG
jgi:hypothetical protein